MLLAKRESKIIERTRIADALEAIAESTIELVKNTSASVTACATQPVAAGPEFQTPPLRGPF